MSKKRTATATPAPDDRCPKCGRSGPVVASIPSVWTYPYSGGTLSVGYGSPWYSVTTVTNTSQTIPAPKKRKRRK